MSTGYVKGVSSNTPKSLDSAAAVGFASFGSFDLSVLGFCKCSLLLFQFWHSFSFFRFRCGRICPAPHAVLGLVRSTGVPAPAEAPHGAAGGAQPAPRDRARRGRRGSRNQTLSRPGPGPVCGHTENKLKGLKRAETGATTARGNIFYCMVILNLPVYGSDSLPCIRSRVFLNASTSF